MVGYDDVYKITGSDGEFCAIPYLHKSGSPPPPN